MSSNWVDAPGAAEYLGTPVRHVRTLVETRRLLHYKLSGKIRFKVTDLDAFLEASRVDVRPPKTA